MLNGDFGSIHHSQTRFEIPVKNSLPPPEELPLVGPVESVPLQ
jgi:hypothetical protein